MQFRIIGPAMLALWLLMPAASLAQAPPQSKSEAAPPKETHDPSACANSRGTVGKGGGDSEADAAKEDGRTLSDKLAQSKGVICPPEQVDPEIKAPTPQGGRTPVIPPPGSPGGNPNVQPK